MCLGPFNILTGEGCYEMALSRHLSNHIFHSLQFRKYISCEGHSFYEFF